MNSPTELERLYNQREQIQQWQDNYYQMVKSAGWIDMKHYCENVVNHARDEIENRIPNNDGLLEHYKQIGIVLGIKKVLEYENNLKYDLDRINNEIKRVELLMETVHG